MIRVRTSQGVGPSFRRERMTRSGNWAMRRLSPLRIMKMA
jgi:hypothetical protein